jgi:hypothetical protein
MDTLGKELSEAWADTLAAQKNLAEQRKTEEKTELQHQVDTAECPGRVQDNEAELQAIRH